MWSILSRWRSLIPFTPESVDEDAVDKVASKVSQNFGGARLVIDQGRTQYLGNSLWSRVVEEFPDSTLIDASDEESLARADDASHSNFILNPTPNPNHKPQHPDPEAREKLWETFVLGVDPVCKVVHVPTLKPAVDAAYKKLD